MAPVFVCRVRDVGLASYMLYFVLYMASVEFFVYWQHRIMHMGAGYRCAKPERCAVPCMHKGNYIEEDF